MHSIREGGVVVLARLEDFDAGQGRAAQIERAAIGQQRELSASKAVQHRHPAQPPGPQVQSATSAGPAQGNPAGSPGPSQESKSLVGRPIVGTRD